MSRAIRAIQNLAIARQAEFGDESMKVYGYVLQGVDEDAVAEACKRLAMQPRGDFESAMPTAADIRRHALSVTAERKTQADLARLLPMPNRDKDEPVYACPDCRDEPNGWRLFYCKGTGEGFRADAVPPADHTVTPCARMKSHTPHPYVERCACLPTNPVIRLAKERMAAHAAKREERSHGR